MDGHGKRVLIVDDDHHARLLMGSLLDHAGYNVVPACDGLGALNELSRRHFDVVITDYRMPLLGGVKFLRQLRAHDPALPVILVSGTLPEDTSQLDSPPFACLRKPYEHTRLLALVQSAVGGAVARATHEVSEAALR